MESPLPLPAGRALFVGCARDCGPWLDAVLANVRTMAGLFEEAAFIVVENDSSDDTAAILARAAALDPRLSVICLDGLAAQVAERTRRLAIARNRCLDEARARFADYDYLIVLDFDQANAEPIDPAAVAQARAFLDADPAAAAVFANQLGHYYDLWALRHPQQCPDDIWEAVCDEVILNQVSDMEAFGRRFRPRLFQLHPHIPPVEVDSAFGGLGLYKMPKVLANRARYLGHKIKRYSRDLGGWEMCEHVAFHKGFRDNGDKLFIAPSLINRTSGEISYNPSHWRGFVFDLDPSEQGESPA